MNDMLLSTIIAVALTYIIIRPFYKRSKQREAEEIQRIYKTVETVLKRHKNQLGVEREKCAHVDSYGEKDYNRWYEKELAYFLERHLMPELYQYREGIVMALMDDIAVRTDRVAQKNKPKDLGFTSKMTGKEFELFCAMKFEKEGWKVSPTKDGADQGVDLVIEKSNRKIAIQCKKYGRPVGNKAVQEVKSGMDFYNAQKGVVITNSTFTKSAQELAKATNIQLLHFDETHEL